MPLYKKQVDDSAYGAGWNGDTTKAPSKNAVYDKIETLGGGGNVSNTGTPVDNQIAVWTNSTTIEGDAAFTFNTTSDTLTIGNSTDGTIVGGANLVLNDGGDGQRVQVITTDGTSLNSTGGELDIWTGDATNGNAAGGWLNIITGNGIGTGAGGDATIDAGDGGATGRGGQVALYGGAGGATSGTGGGVSLVAGNATAGNSNGGDINIIAGNKSGSGTSGILDLETESGKLRLNGALFSPQTSDTVALGSGTLMWSDLFLASGGVLNFNNGNATITHSAGLLTSNVDIAVPDEAYGVGWNGSTEVPTKNAVYDKIEALGGGSNITKAITQASHGFAVGDVLKYASSTYAKAQADSTANAEVVGIVSAVAGVNDFTLLTAGYISGLSGLTANTTYFLSASSAGALTSTEPSTAGQVSKPLLRAISTTEGYFVNMRGVTVPSASTGDVYALTAKPTTYYTYTIPWFARADSQADDNFSGWTASGYTTGSEGNGFYGTFVTTGGNSFMYTYDNSTGGLPGVNSNEAFRFNDSKKVVFSCRFKGDSSGNWCVGIGTGTNANWYTASTSSAGGDRAVFAYDGSTFYSITDNGTSVTRNSVTATVTNWLTLRIEFDPGSAVRFYVDGTLVNTHSTNLPDSGNVLIGHGHSTTGRTYRMSAPTISLEI